MFIILANIFNYIFNLLVSYIVKEIIINEILFYGFISL